MRIRLKESCNLLKWSTKYGVVTREYNDFPEGSQVFNDMEVEGQEEPVPKPAPKPAPKPEPRIVAVAPKVTIGKPKVLKRKARY